MLQGWVLNPLVKKHGEYVSSVTAVVSRIQLKDMGQPIEAIWGLDSVCLIVCVLLDSVFYHLAMVLKRLWSADPTSCEISGLSQRF